MGAGKTARGCAARTPLYERLAQATLVSIHTSTIVLDGKQSHAEFVRSPGPSTLQSFCTVI